MKITYLQLAHMILHKMTKEQQGSDVVVEAYDGDPIIWVNMTEPDMERLSDSGIDSFCKDWPNA